MDAPGLATEKQGRFIPAPRLRVLERIRRAARYPITVIAAPAGYGKTVALRHYLQTLDGPVVRYDVRPSDSTLFGFVQGLARAFSTVAPALMQTLPAAYDSSQKVSDCALALAQWMHAHLRDFEGVIAIDDLHVAQSDPLAETFLQRLIDMTKEKTVWVIASRGIGALPVASWIAYGDMEFVIDDRDLRMTLEEAHQMASSLAPGVGENEITALVAATQAWPTALNFALRSSTSSRDLREAAATSRELLYRYLAEQVYRSLQPQHIELLNFVAHLQEIDIRVLECAGFESAAAMLDELHARIGFIYPERTGIYRCHDLFREFLRYQSGVSEAYRAARALERAEHLLCALQMYAEVQSERDVLRMLRMYGQHFLEHAQSDAVSHALDALSGKSRASQPVALALSAIREVASGRFARAESLLKSAVHETHDDELFAELSIRLGNLLFNQGREASEYLQPIAENGSLPHKYRLRALSLIAPSYVARGRDSDALNALEQMKDFAKTSERGALAAQILHRAAIVALSLRRTYGEVAALFSDSASMAMECGALITAAAALGGASTAVLLYEDDLAKAADCAEQAIEAAMKAGSRLTLQTAILQLVNIETWRGNPDRLESLLTDLAHIAAESPFAGYELPAVAMMSAWRGDANKAFLTLANLQDDPSVDFERCFNRSVLALYAVGSGRRDAAMEIVETLQSELAAVKADSRHAAVVLETARSLSAITAALAGRVSLAYRLLAPEPEAQVPEIDAIRVCANVVCRSVTQTSAGNLPEAIATVGTRGRRGISLLLERLVLPLLDDSQEESALTRAELEILAALAQGRSPKEIAQASGRSVHTVRTLSQRAIRKLGCSGRQQAIVVAQRRGFLGEPFGRPA